ncbi:MAG: hypothetical protein K6E98_05615 [Lachnospiraceae bacterium]|nr:hypothetical protein [Lachnospiraceae bacterium]
MKKYGKKLMMVMAVTLLMSGCAKQNTAGPVNEAAGALDSSTANTEEVDTDKADKAEKTDKRDKEDNAEPKEEAMDRQEASSKESEDSYEDPDNLPQYVYQGSEQYMDVISDYLIESEKELMGSDVAQVYIPFAIIAEVDDKDPSDIIAYGAYNIKGYDLLNTTLFATTGSWSNGALHLKTNEDGTYTVTDAELAMVDEESREIFAPVPGLYDKVNQLVADEADSLLEENIAEYVSINNLNITQCQDYCWAPVAVKNAKETPETAQFYTFESPFGYQLTYDLRELSLMSSDEDDMYGKVEEESTGTLMVIEKSEETNVDAAIKEALSHTNAENIKSEEAAVAGIACHRAEYDETIEDGRIFRYVCYAISKDDGILTIRLETTVEQGVSELSVKELEEFFKPALDTLVL